MLWHWCMSIKDKEPAQTRKEKSQVSMGPRHTWCAGIPVKKTVNKPLSLPRWVLTQQNRQLNKIGISKNRIQFVIPVLAKRLPLLVITKMPKLVDNACLWPNKLNFRFWKSLNFPIAAEPVGIVQFLQHPCCVVWCWAVWQKKTKKNYPICLFESLFSIIGGGWSWC